MKDKTLLQKALKRPERSWTSENYERLVITQEDIDLALAWVNDEISASDVIRAYTTDNGRQRNIYSRLARALKAHLRNKK